MESDDDARVKKFMEFLDSRHYTLWGTSFTIASDPDGQRRAAEWFIDQIDAFARWYLTGAEE